LKNSENRSNFNSFCDFWAPILITVGLYTGIRTYLAEARYIPSGSMLPGLRVNDRLVIEKLTFRRRSPRRGEIVVFNSPYSFDNQLLAKRTKQLPSSLTCAFLNFPLTSSLIPLRDPACDAYIKRVVAVGGDQVVVNLKGEVFINGSLVEEPYVSNFCKLLSRKFSNCKSLKTIVPSSNVLVLGDNRANSWDGRYWPGGPFLAEKEIIGKATFRFWPIPRIGMLGH